MDTDVESSAVVDHDAAYSADVDPVSLDPYTARSYGVDPDSVDLDAAVNPSTSHSYCVTLALWTL